MRLPNKFNGCSADGRRLYFKGGGGTSTTVQSIPTELKPLASAYTNKAIDLANTGYQAYGGQRYANMNGYQNQAVNQISNLANNGTAVGNAGENLVNNTLNGDYLNNNPYLDASFKAQSGAVTDAYNDATKATDATMARSGAFGGSAWQQAQQNNSDTLAKNLGNLSTSVYASNYATERQNQVNAANQALNYENQAYAGANQLMNAGNTVQDQAQQKLDYGYQQYQDQQNLPYKQLAAMSGVFGSNLGSTSTTNSTGGGK